MKFETVLSNVRKLAEKADVSNVDFLAVQVNLTDTEPNVFIQLHKPFFSHYKC